jgi:hypothetical protein
MIDRARNHPPGISGAKTGTRRALAHASGRRAGSIRPVYGPNQRLQHVRHAAASTPPRRPAHRIPLPATLDYILEIRCAKASTAAQSVNSTLAVGSVGPWVSHMMNRIMSRSSGPYSG